MNPFEKERGDKNIIKLPGDGAVWVSYLYCFIECFHDREGNLLRLPVCGGINWLVIKFHCCE